MFKLLKSMQNVYFKYVTRLSLFITNTGGELSYASEICCFHKGNADEKTYLEYFKMLLKERKNTLSLMIFNKLVRLPPFIQRKIYMSKCKI